MEEVCLLGMSVEFKNRVVLIPGGSSGIGLALAMQLAAREARLCLLARTQERLDAAVSQLNAVHPGDYLAVSADVTDPRQVNMAVEEVVSRMGVPDLVINCASAAHPGYIWDLGLDVFHWMIEVNYLGTVYVTKSILPSMLDRGSGHIVNFGSLVSFVGVLGYTAYGASKFAVRGFTDALRMEVTSRGIRVSIVYPGDTDTPQLAYENQFKPPELKNLLPEMGVASPEKVALATIKGIQQDRYQIFPDPGSALLYQFIRLAGGLIYPTVDFLFTRARRKIARDRVDDPRIEKDR